MQESRLFQIVYYLLDHGQATAAELAEKLEVSVRTIYRDIDVLSSAGIPVYAEQGRGGGIRLLNDFILEKAILSAQDKQEILVALQSMSALWQQTDSHVLQKLSALFAAKTESWLEVDFSRWGNERQDQEKFALFKWAILHRHVVEITYVGSRGQRGTRRIEPLKLLYKSSAWYVQAFCQEKQDFRVFKINRILTCTLLEDIFFAKQVPMQTMAQQNSQRKVVLHFAAAVAYRVYDEFALEQIQILEDGSLLAAAEMPCDGWLIGYILSFGTDVEIIAPQDLRQVVVQQVEKIHAHHKS